MSGIQFKITISNNVKIVRKGLQNLWRKLPEVGRDNVYQALLKVITRLKIYPPKRPGQKYVRTFTLRRGWRLNKVNERAYRISNGTPYTHYVVGNAFGVGQAWMHAGRWILFRDQVDRVFNQLPKTINNNLKTVARREGLPVK